ncbi:TBC1 domain family member 2B [Sarcoptes scabiei]|uniref:TBC1 domain family member 2B n=1 Tax=Sarcoptes scabiei TaxID=52283 RepID=A0A834VEA7_SARSC|nr:TBC1 domain family member 2B [Sarcoptes scabiei]
MMSEQWTVEPNLPRKLSNNENVLQGYLLKHSTQQLTESNKSSRTEPNSSLNLIHLRKKRWFLFNSQNGKLYYYRTKEDLFPLGEIDINQSSFILTSPTPGIESFRFEIRSGVKQFTLEASSPSEGYHWIRTLQQYRQNYFKNLIDFTDDLQGPSDLNSDLKNSKELQENLGDRNDVISFDSVPNRSSLIDHSDHSEIDELSKASKMQQRTRSLPPNHRDNRMKISKKNDKLFHNSSTTPSSSPSKTLSNNSQQNDRKTSRMFAGMFGKSIGSDDGTESPHLRSSNSRDSKSKNNCAKCSLSQTNLITMQHDKMALEDEVKTNREVIKILQEQLRICNGQNVTNFKCSDLNDPDCDDLMALRIKINIISKENEKLKQENRSLIESKQVLEEMLESRDQTLVSLTHEIYDLECKNARIQNHAELEREFIQDEMPRKLKQKIEQLEDTAIAFEQQNHFLNKEIIELNEIKRIYELKHKQSEAKLCEVEAKSSQIQSKLLSLLKEINNCILEEEKNRKEEFHGFDGSKQSIGPDHSLFITNESVKQLVSRLLEESSLDIPLSWKPGNRPRLGWSNSIHNQKNQEYDELGFYYQTDRLRSYDHNLDPDRNEIAWRSRWDHFMSNLSNHGEIPIGNPELKQMIRLGVPQDYRCKIWRSLIQQHVKSLKLRLGDNYYDTLLRNRPSFRFGSQSNVLDPSAKQIELDLLRTLPNNRLNRLAAVALLFMPEEDAFWCLVAIVEKIMPKEYFGRNLLGAHVDQYVLRDLISNKIPQLSQVMDQNQIEISLFAWFLTIFVDNVPVFVYLHIWDVFLHEGSKILFRFALAILRLNEQELLQMTDSASMNQFLRTLDERHFNLQRLSDIAFRELNPFPSKLVKFKRNHYTSLVKEELKKIDEFRSSLKSIAGPISSITTPPTTTSINADLPIGSNQNLNTNSSDGDLMNKSSSQTTSSLIDENDSD